MSRFAPLVFINWTSNMNYITKAQCLHKLKTSEIVKLTVTLSIMSNDYIKTDLTKPLTDF